MGTAPSRSGFVTIFQPIVSKTPLRSASSPAKDRGHESGSSDGIRRGSKLMGSMYTERFGSVSSSRNRTVPKRRTSGLSAKRTGTKSDHACGSRRISWSCTEIETPLPLRAKRIGISSSGWADSVKSRGPRITLSATPSAKRSGKRVPPVSVVASSTRSEV